MLAEGANEVALMPLVSSEKVTAVAETLPPTRAQDTAATKKINEVAARRDANLPSTQWTFMEIL
jgi:hypothetical protein